MSPLRERATRRFNILDWMRGEVATPHPAILVEQLELPSPARGEGATTSAAFS